MKRNLSILILLFVFVSATYSQQKKQFVLQGNIKGLEKGTSVYLLTRNADTVAVSKASGAKFRFKGHVEGDADYYFLKLDTNVSKDYSNALWLINGKMTVSGDVKEFKDLQLKGSDAQNDWLEFKALQDKTKTDSERLEMNKSFVKSHPNSLFTPYIIKSDLEASYGILTDRSKNSYWGKELKKKIDLTKTASAFTAAGKIPDFKMTAPDGKVVSIYDIAKQSKYTLIDFWASWCGPCRAAIPKLAKTYNEFKDKGFNIVGLSTDKKEGDWKKALSEDNTPWVHGLDNVDMVGKNLFGLMAIPGYILIDQEGKIIQSDYFSNLKAEQIRTFKDKSLSANLHEIIESVFN